YYAISGKNFSTLHAYAVEHLKPAPEMVLGSVGRNLVEQIFALSSFIAKLDQTREVRLNFLLETAPRLAVNLKIPQRVIEVSEIKNFMEPKVQNHFQKLYDIGVMDIFAGIYLLENEMITYLPDGKIVIYGPLPDGDNRLTKEFRKLPAVTPIDSLRAALKTVTLELRQAINLKEDRNINSLKAQHMQKALRGASGLEFIDHQELKSKYGMGDDIFDYLQSLTGKLIILGLIDSKYVVFCNDSVALFDQPTKNFESLPFQIESYAEKVEEAKAKFILLQKILRKSFDREQSTTIKFSGIPQTPKMSVPKMTLQELLNPTPSLPNPFSFDLRKKK
ncbi:MAG: hypothetical protein WD512_20975, partial [Candidatus Paceibacterota bacterium]